MSAAGRFIGSWETRSGNGVDLHLVGGLDGEGLMRCEWDRLPLTNGDLYDWRQRIRPAAAGRVRELLELTGATLVIEL